MNLKDIEIRLTTSEDFDNIMQVQEQGFGYDKEAKLVAGLLGDETAEPIVSLMAFYKEEAVGHILFTRGYLDKNPDKQMMHILAPLAVKPQFQRMGIGGLLIQEGLRILQDIGSKLVFVLGHKEYYPKYGFLSDATRLGFPAPYPILDEFAEYWMVQPISKDGLNLTKGKINCAAFLDRPEHWRDDDADK